MVLSDLARPAGCMMRVPKRHGLAELSVGDSIRTRSYLTTLKRPIDGGPIELGMKPSIRDGFV